MFCCRCYFRENKKNKNEKLIFLFNVLLLIFFICLNFITIKFSIKSSLIFLFFFSIRDVFVNYIKNNDRKIKKSKLILIIFLFLF